MKLIVNICALAFKSLTLSNTEDDIKVTIWATIKAYFPLALKTHLISIFNPSRNFHFHFMCFIYLTMTVTGWTFFFNFLSCTMTHITGCLTHHTSKWCISFNINHTCTMTFRTCCRMSTWFSTSTMTSLTFVTTMIMNRFFFTKDSFFKG